MIIAAELASLLGVTPQYLIKVQKNLVENEDFIVHKNRRRSFTPVGIRKIFSSRGYNFQKQVWTLGQLKGGVGKSAIACALASKCSSLGFKTLLVDLDKQSNSTEQFWNDIPEDNRFPCFIDVLNGTAKFEDCIVELDSHLDLFPSNIRNQLADIEIVNKSLNLGNYLKKIVDKLDYDIIIFDTEPNLSKLNLMAVAASSMVISPVKMDRNSVDGLDLLLQQIDLQREQWPELDVEIRALFNAFDKRVTKANVKRITTVHDMGINTFATIMRTDQEYVRFQDTGEIRKRTKAYEDVEQLTIEALNLSSIQKVVH